MREVLRIYPLRMNKKKWRIPIHIKHQCSENCSKIYTPDESDEYNYILQDNPEYKDGKCPKHNQLDYGVLKLSSFSYDDPRGIFGPLHNPNEVVIPDQHIFIDINYPMITNLTVKINFGHANISRSELLYTISSMYKYIYEIEEQTSPSLQYTVVKECDKCVNKSAYDCVTEMSIVTNNDDCSICFHDYTVKKAVQLPCGHIFHDECAKKWLGDTDNNTCPLCRNTVLKCDGCEGKRCTYEEYESVVIPIEHRSNVSYRNPTFGMFGIYGRDLEDLCLHEMEYDKENKKLNLIIS